MGRMKCNLLVGGASESVGMYVPGGWDVPQDWGLRRFSGAPVDVLECGGRNDLFLTLQNPACGASCDDVCTVEVGSHRRPTSNVRCRFRLLIQLTN